MNTAKHIDVITTYFYPVTAGIETNILETYSELVRLGWSVNVHTSASTLDAKNNLASSDSVRGINIIRYRIGVFGYIPVLNFSSSSLICLHNFNVVPHIYIYLFSWLRRIVGLPTPKIFLTPHGGFTPEWQTFPWIARTIKRLYHRYVGLWLINTQTSLVRAISPWEKRALIRQGVNPRRVVLIKNGLDKAASLDHERLANPETKKKVADLGRYFVAVGRIAPIKNYETMIRAVALLPKGTKLAIVGPVQDAAYLERLEGLARSLHISERIKFLGTLHGSDKYYVVRHAICQIHLARWESFCNVVYEAKSLGQICVVADNTALTSLIKNRHDGFVTGTYDVHQLANILGAIQDNAQASHVRNMRATLKRESFPTWEMSAKKMHFYYRTLAK